MKKATMMIIAAIIVFAALTFISTEAKAGEPRNDCECWIATYSESSLKCTFYMCLIPPNPYSPQTGDYSFIFDVDHAGEWTEIELHPERLSSCESPCIAWWCEFHWDYNPLDNIEWYVNDNVTPEGHIWDNTDMPNCAAIPF